MDKYRTLLGNSLLFTFSRLGSKAILFLLVPLYTACLTQAEYGIAELVTTSVEIIIPIITLGMQNAVFRFAFDKNNDSKDVLKCFYWVFFMSGAVTAVICVLLRLSPTFSEYRYIIFFLTLLTVFNETYGLFLKAKDRTKVFAIDGIIYIIALAAANVFLLKTIHLGIEGYLLSIVIAKTVSIAYMFIFGKTERFAFPKKVNYILLKQMVAYGLPLIANSLSWWIIHYADRYMLFYMTSAAVVGVYTVASKIPSLITTFNTIVMDAWAISYITEFEKGQSGDFYGKVFEGYSTAISLLSSAIMLILYPFMHIYVSQDYYGAIEVVPMLLIGGMFQSYSSFVGAVFSAEKKSSVFMTSSILGAAVNIVLNFILIPRYEMMGAAFATMLAYIAMMAYRFYRAKAYVDMKLSMRWSMTLALLMIQMVSTTLAFHNNIISVLAIVMIFIFNYSTVKRIIATVIRSLKK